MDDEIRWSAVQARAREAAFVYAVTTTGIYCVPSCPARRPKRSNVEFFDEPAAARRAGYRACQRCSPDAEHAPADVLVMRACAFILERDTPPKLEQVARAVGASPSHLHRVFTACLGQSPRAFAADVRAHRVRTALAAGSSVTAALHEAGYGSSSRFYAQVDATLGMAPQRYRDHGEGVTIQATLVETRRGLAMVAATARGVCALALGEHGESLLAALRERFVRATFVPADAAFESTVARVVVALDRTSLLGTVPLDLRGTVFQHQVWRAISTLGPGHTASYAEIADALGRPSAARAVAAACAANEVAILVPCHRVVGSDGSLTGYRWGLERKRALLSDERGA